MTARIVLVRHGESAWNVEDRYQGHADSGLTAIGRHQAAHVARWLGSRLDRQPATIATSDLVRARDTAQPFLDLVGSTAVADDRLREVDTGDWTGRLFTDIAVSHPDDVAAAARGEDVRRGGGETFAEVRTRVWSALRELATGAAASEPGSGRPTVVVFTHGGPIRVAAAHALGLPSPGHRALAPPTNCSVTILDVDRPDGATQLVQYSTPTNPNATASLAE